MRERVQCCRGFEEMYLHARPTDSSALYLGDRYLIYQEGAIFLEDEREQKGVGAIAKS